MRGGARADRGFMTSTTHQPETFAVAPLEPVRAARSAGAIAARLRPRGRAWLAHALVPAAVLGVAVLLAEGHGVSWLAGVVAGAALSARLILGRAHTEAPTVGVFADALAPAEALTLAGPSASAPGPALATAEELTALESSGWRVLHDLEGRLGTYEQVAVGPGGLVLLDSLRFDHPVATTLSEADRSVRRELDRTRRRVHATAADLRDELELLDGRRPWVQTVVVVWSEFAPGRVIDGRCVVVSGARLTDWLRRRPGQLSSDRADALLEALGKLAGAAA